MAIRAQRGRQDRLDGLVLGKRRGIDRPGDVLEVVDDDRLVGTLDVGPKAEGLALLVVDNVVGEVGKGRDDLVGGAVGERQHAPVQPVARQVDGLDVEAGHDAEVGGAAL